MDKYKDVAVIGGGQAGLSMSYHLSQQGVEHVVLEQADCIADSWRQRYDSLALITPNWMNGLTGLTFPGEADSFGVKSDVISYLENYAVFTKPPLQLGCRVTAVNRSSAGFVIDTTSLSLRARHVVLATGPFQQPKFPDFYRATTGQVCHLHSSQYRNPQQLPPGDVLVVGSGNSGVQIAVELARQSNVFLSRERDAAIPRRIRGQDFVGILPKFGINDRHIDDQDRDRVADFMWWMDKFGLYEMPIGTPLGQILGRGSDPYIGESMTSVLKSTDIVLMDKVVDMHGDTVVFADGKELQPRSVIWCTGYQHDYGWVHAPAFDDRFAPMHERGVTRVPGLFVLGLRWMHMADSGLLRGVGRDAAYLSSQIAAVMKKSA